MKLSEQWLREWVNPDASIEEIAEKLVMGGLELEIEPVVPELPIGVVVGKIESVEPHPDAERLRITRVNAGKGSEFVIVCGAPNARVGMLAPVALPGARLMGGLEIKVAKLRGVESSGMLCSAAELGLSESADGLLELDPTATIGTPIEHHLMLDDKILNLEITPNRGDCLSVLGLAREVAALFDIPLKKPRFKPAVVVGVNKHLVSIENNENCSAYAGRVIYGLNAGSRTPDAMRERLHRSGIRSISALVDITNYVMLEVGQPMHAFDGARLNGGVSVRQARDGEKLTLLNDQALSLDPRDLLICDESGPVALAGVMGGQSTAVSGSSSRVFFESACFAPDAVAGTGRRHRIQSDALYRFERGVDPELQRLALERATEITIGMCGGEPGPVSFAGNSNPEIKVTLRHERLSRLLGCAIPAREVEKCLGRLGINTRNESGGVWSTTVPSWRPDLRIEPDLIEEVARIYGYDRIPAKPYASEMSPGRPSESRRQSSSLKRVLVSRGWQEVISLAFVDQQVQALMNPETDSVMLDNPIADNLEVMRSSLWPGLVNSWKHNHARQNPRLRLFEHGVCFTRSTDDQSIVETARFAGLAAGSCAPEQWDLPAADRGIDFFDVKTDLEALSGASDALGCESARHPALHTGRSARLTRRGKTIGWLGEVHPALISALDLPGRAILFEMDAEALSEVDVPKGADVPEFPASRRDIAFVVPESVTALEIRTTIESAAPSSLREVKIFDVYRGDNLGNTFKSVALGLIFQESSRTLTDVETDSAMEAIIAEVVAKLGASVRT